MSSVVILLVLLYYYCTSITLSFKLKAPVCVACISPLVADSDCDGHGDGVHDGYDDRHGRHRDDTVIETYIHVHLFALDHQKTALQQWEINYNNVFK